MGPLRFDPIGEAGRHWRERWSARAASSMMAATSVMRAQQILLARLNGALEPHGLTFPRYEALMLLYLSRRGELPLGKMGARLQVHPTSVTSLIDRLQKDGMVTRKPHPSDRRTVLARITARGRRTAQAATEALNEVHFGFEPLRADELEAVIAVLGKLRLTAGDFVEGC